MAKGRSGLGGGGGPMPAPEPDTPQLTPGLEFLGPKGDPKDMREALTTSNPNFYKGVEWRRNCQRCIYAYEMQRRGYDVEAMPRILDGTDRLPYMYDPNGWLSVMENAKVESFTSRGTIKQMLTKMADYGDGSRAIVKVTWKGRRSGHVFIAEQEGSATTFLDPQTGRYVDIHEYMNDAIKGSTNLIRIDNLKPTKLLEKCVKKRNS